MDNFYLTDEDIHALDEDTQTAIWENDLNKANEKIEELQDIINTVRLKLELANKINERCICEETNKAIKKVLEIETKHNNELLELLKCDDYE